MNTAPSKPWDLLLAGGRLVDPANHIDAERDVAIQDGKVVAVGPDLDPNTARAVENIRGMTLAPGLIDAHVHLGEEPYGYHMVAQTGVVTAIDFAGDADALNKAVNGHGAAGLSIGFLKPVVPGRTVSSADIPEAEQERFLDSIDEVGALGVKLVGGHYPVEPHAFAGLVRRAAARRIFIASHVGTTRAGSNLEGLREAIDLAEGNPLYIAHVNSYCRGVSGRNPVQEAAMALEWIEAAPNLTTENYVARINGTSSECRDGVPVSRVTQVSLERGGFPATEQGLAEAIRSGFARVQVPSGSVMILAEPEAGLTAWKVGRTMGRVSFPLNSIAACCALALARDARGKLIIDILSTDGGRHPRNTLVEAGLALCRTGGLSLAEFVQKASLLPARALGLPGKGHLSPGADGDATVLDPERCRAVLSVSAGHIVMRGGECLGGRGRMVRRTAGTETA